jgi:hypothetical protein
LTMRFDRVATGGMSSIDTVNVRSTRYRGMRKTIVERGSRRQGAAAAQPSLHPQHLGHRPSAPELWADGGGVGALWCSEHVGR